ncbi:hypothetical protein J5X84_08810 [Streptosporangiaceae bacterium NEAU-GS5]|nr:hypothetical protein [Streptosporangiaceae bacterium NEAU-GS5]
MNVGNYVQRTVGLKDRVGKPLAASSKEGQLAALRRFFTDCQECEWLPRRFDPATRAGDPAQHRRSARPEPRVIADEIWAKLVQPAPNDPERTKMAQCPRRRSSPMISRA